MNPTSVLHDTNEEKQYCDLLKSCRVCLSSNMNMNSIYNEPSNETISKIEFCTGIQLKKENGLPSKICKKCLRKLSIAYQFKTMCIVTEKTLQQILLQRIKVELPDISDIDTKSFRNTGVDEPVDVKIEDQECYYDTLDTIEKNENSRSEIRKSQRKCMSIGNSKQENFEVRKRGPYKKGSAPRLKKFKFTKLFCASCDLKFASKQERDEHKRSSHPEPESWMCEVCGKTFAHRGSHYTHVRSHGAPAYSCAHCDYRCHIKADLEKHIRVHLGIKKFSCPECAGRYRTSSNLRQHVRRQHRAGPKRFACPLCARRFHDRTKLNRHVDAHNAVKRFKCELCHSCFARRCQWKKHLEKQHSVLVPAQRPGRRPTGAPGGDAEINIIKNV